MRKHAVLTQPVPAAWHRMLTHSGAEAPHPGLRTDYGRDTLHGSAGRISGVSGDNGELRQSSIAIIGAPMDLGAGRRGVDMGPSALRVANLNDRVASLGYEVADLGNVRVDQPETLPAGPSHARYLPQIAHTCARLADMVQRAAGQERVPLVLGGDHSAAVGTIAGMSRHRRKSGHKLGLLWMDAHADMNTP